MNAFTFTNSISLRLLHLAAGLTVCLAGCAAIDDKAQTLFASRASAAGVVGGRLLLGEASYAQARMGTLHLHSRDAPAFDCMGALQLTASTSGVASMTCSDGQSVAIPFQLLGALRAAGRAPMGASQFSFTYGLPPDMAAPYLGLAVERLLPPAE